jgi:HAMP domain-containing protein
MELVGKIGLWFVWGIIFVLALVLLTLILFYVMRWLLSRTSLRERHDRE